MLLEICFGVAIACIITLSFSNYVVDCIRFSRLLSKLPGPKPLPVIGNILELACERELFFRKIRKWSQEYAPMYILSAFKSPAVNVSGAETFEVIAGSTKNLQKSMVYKFLRRWLGDGLLTTTGSKWHTRRKILTPAFHFNILQQFVKIFHEETRKLVDTLKKEVDEPWTDVIPLISQFTLFTIAETSMGIKLNMENREHREYVESINKLGPLIFHRLLRPWLHNNFLYYHAFVNGFKERKLINTIHRFTDSIIAEKLKNFKKFEKGDGEYDFSQRKKLALLDLLLNAKLGEGIIDDEGIRDEVNTFMFEGYDTTSTAICFILMLLSIHKNWQDLVHEEILQVLGDSTEDPSLNDLNDLKIMERVVKECLRLYPSVPFIGRLLEEDTMINGFLIPKQTLMHVHIFDIHRNPKYWTDPEKFDPDRFLTENCVNRHPFAYVPFSAGPRNCIGQKFAMLEIKAVLCGILRNFALEPQDTPDTIKIVPDLVLRTTDGKIRVKFRSRQ
ncbi:cytochrome P450 4C1 [Leptinotarsa decemlineata]